MTPYIAVVLANIRLDLCFRVDQLLQESCEGAEIEVTDDRLGRKGNLHCYFRRLVHGIGKLPASGKGPCVFADGKEKELECRSWWQKFYKFLEN